MGVKYQRNRIYSLIVGSKDDAVEINTLEMKFNVVKTSDNTTKKNSAWVEIYNLSDDRRKKLETEFITLSLSVGYTDTGLHPLFSGQAVGVTNTKLKGFRTKRQGTDLVTHIDVDGFFTALNNTSLSTIVPAGRTVGDAIKAAAGNIPSLTKFIITGHTIAIPLIDGYPLSGSPRSNLDKLAKAYGFEWQIDGGTLYVSDSDGSHTTNTDGVPLIGQMSGLIDRPAYVNETAKAAKRIVKNKASPNVKPKPNAIKFSILLNPEIVAGSIIKLDFPDVGGYYKVSQVTHKGDYRGNDWVSELICTERVA